MSHLACAIVRPSNVTSHHRVADARPHRRFQSLAFPLHKSPNRSYHTHRMFSGLHTTLQIDLDVARRPAGECLPSPVANYVPLDSIDSRTNYPQDGLIGRHYGRSHHLLTWSRLLNVTSRGMARNARPLSNSQSLMFRRSTGSACVSCNTYLRILCVLVMAFVLAAPADGGLPRQTPIPPPTDADRALNRVELTHSGKFVNKK